MFESEFIKTDVTAVKLLDHHILAGIGNYLNIFDINGSLIRKTKIFDGQKIHGILIEAENLLLFGGCHINTLKWKSESSTVESLHNEQIEDWVLTAQWLKDGTFAVVVMKNKLAVYGQSLNKLREFICQEECILYSAFIAYDEKEGNLVVLSGTVFGEVLVWKVAASEKSRPLPVLARLTGHNGVIFSIHYNRNNGYICSSSDDRSTILWSPKTSCIHKESKEKSPEITQIRKFYGHQSRIFRSLLTDSRLLTAGEDSFVNVWNFQGELLNKIPTDQGGPVWALDCNENVVISGGGGCGILMSSIESANCVNFRLRVPEDQIPKRIALLNDGNLIVFAENGGMYFYLEAMEKWTKIQQHDDLKSYCLLEISQCRNLFALAGYRGEIYIYESRTDSVELLVKYGTTRKSRICSFHWLTCQTFLTCDGDGMMSLHFLSHEKKITFITSFNLPKASNLWSTAACQTSNGLYVIGDRRGNIYVYELKTNTPIQTLKKVHNHLGITRLLNSGEKVQSLGRDGTVKTFLLAEDGTLRLCSTDKVPFTWLTNLIDSTFLLAFSGKFFVIWDYATKRVLLEHLCGGGHRAWDVAKQNGNVIFSYVKERTISVVKWQENKILPKNVVLGYHISTINSMSLVKAFERKFILASGSEDTTLRIVQIGRNEFTCLENFKSHLSSIKASCVHKLTKDSSLLFSGGGRGQIICWKLILNDNIECRQEYSHYEGTNEQFLESEMRIMDLKVLQFQDDLLLFSACSDGNINVFQVRNENNECRFDYLRSLFHKVKCVSKISLIRLSSFYILIAMSTDGIVSFWDLSRIKDTTKQLTPFKMIKIHQSGILSCCFRLLEDNLAVFMTGGDDACIVLNLFKIAFRRNSVDFVSLSHFRDCSSHCAQVTGIWMGQDRFLTTSIDQKLLVFEWRVDESRRLCLRKLARYDSAVADIQGMECVQDRRFVHVFLYGKGVEYVKVEKNKIS